MATRVAWVLAVLCIAGCGEPDAAGDGGARDGGPPIAELDAQVPTDGSGAPADAGSSDAGGLDAGSDPASDDAGSDDAGSDDAGSDDAGSGDAGRDAAMARDAGSSDPGVVDVRVLADSLCADLSFDPPSISVPAGTSFTVRWINATGCTEIDIDMNGTVPIVLGLEPGESHHDAVREWCGVYTGTYVFRAYYAPSFPYYLDVDCAG